ATADEGFTLTPNTADGIETDYWFVTVPPIVNLDTECAPTDVVPPQPGTIVTTTDWVDGEYGCDATEVTQWREVSTTTYTLIDNVWVAGPVVTVTETQTRELTADEQAENECPAVIVPPVETPDELVLTGADGVPLAVFGG